MVTTTLSSSEIANHNLLKIYARKSGGEYIKMASDFSASKIVDKLGKPSFGFISATFDKSKVDSVYPSVPTALQGSTFTIAGKIKKKSGKDVVTIQLNFGYGVHVTHQVQYQLVSNVEVETGLVPRFWAQQYINELKLFPEIPGNDEKVLEIGKLYSIVTPNTSLIVLETLDQYLKYEIEPPASLSLLHDEWVTVMELKKREKTEKNEEKINDVLGLWKRRLVWWNQDESSLESSEPYIIHCMEFGKGVDQINKKLVSDWAKYKLDLEVQRGLVDLKIFREKEENERKELEKLRIKEENLQRLREEKFLLNQETQRRKLIEEREKREKLREKNSNY